MRPKKSLGQNFLVDQNYQRKIIEAIHNAPFVMEIGPGRGAITQHLVKTAKQLWLIEKDHELAAQLSETYKTSPHVHVTHDDFLKVDLTRHPREGGDLMGTCEIPASAKQHPYGDAGMTVVGNLPYNVASQIFIKLIQNRVHFCDLYLMFQKEVALRFVAKPKTKDYGLLSLWAQIYTEPKILFHLPPSVFKPKPKVDSSFIHFKIKKTPLLKKEEEEIFWPLARKLFQHRRKMMGTILKNEKVIPDEFAKKRVEELDVEDLVYLLRP